MISTDREDQYTKNQSLNREILLWINQRILSLVIMYKEMGDDAGWDYEYLQFEWLHHFGRNWLQFLLLLIP